MGSLAPHLSQSAVMPHLTAMSPVRLELGVMIDGVAWMMRVGCCWRIWEPSNRASELKNLLIKRGKGRGVGAAADDEDGLDRERRCWWRRETRPLDDKADMPVHQTKVTVTNGRLN